MSSPTFGLVNVYKSGEVLNHVTFTDLRMQKRQAAGCLSCSIQNTIVEWLRAIADELPLEMMLLKIDLCENFNHDSSRRLV